MHNLPFGMPGRFWRGNLHTHSTRSDGKLSPEEVCQLYRTAGYDFISLTDHFLERYHFPLVDTTCYRTADFTTLLGAELHAGQIELGGIWHLLAVGLPQDFAPPSPDESGPEIGARAMETGAFVGIAHPQWYSLTEADIQAVGAMDAIEVYNGVAIDHNDRSESWQITDIFLGRGARYLAYAADDYHGVRGRSDFGRGWVWVKAESLEPELLLAALKAGHFYSSTGPQIFDVEYELGKRVVVRCSPAERILITGKGPLAATVAGSGLMEAEFDLKGWSSPYFRITVRDTQGGRAWSNPVWLDAN